MLPGVMTREHGFTLIDVTMASLITGLVMAIAIPMVESARERYQMTAATREVAAQMRSARLAALSANTTMQVRFDCPAPRQYRQIEMVGDPAIDTDPSRCSAANYPYPATNPAVAPSHDGPVMVLPGRVSFGQLQDIEIDQAGRVTAVGGGVMPATVGVANIHETRNVTVTVAGRIRIP